MTLAQFAAGLREVADQYLYQFPPVVNSTGIDGRYDITINFSPARAFQNATGPAADGDAVASDPNGAISLFDALDKQLGLKLEPRQVTAPVLVIDHLDELPTDNLGSVTK